MNKVVKIFIVDKDETTCAILENYLQEVKCDFTLFKAQSLAEISAMTDDNALNLIVFDVSENLDNAVCEVDNFEETHKNCKFIITSYGLKTDYIIRFLRKSKKDFIEKPVIKTSFLKIVNEIIEKLTSEQDFSGHGKIITVFSNKGGLGKTTVAVNLAYELADMNKAEKVAIVDLNMFLGDVTTFLDITPPYDMKFIADKVDEVEHIYDLAAQYGNTNLYVIADSPYREITNNISKDDIVRLFNALRKNFKYVVVDSSSAITERTKYALDFSDLILLVSEANLPALKNCKKCLDFFEKINVYNKTELVLNRYSYDDDCSVQDVENVLQKTVFNGIPNDWYTVTESINRGLSICEYSQNTAVYDSFVQLARMVTKKVCH